MFQHKGDMECRNDMAFVNADQILFVTSKRCGKQSKTVGRNLGPVCAYGDVSIASTTSGTF